MARPFLSAALFLECDAAVVERQALPYLLSDALYLILGGEKIDSLNGSAM